MTLCIVRDYHRCPERARGAAVAIGNFDGLHTGHQAVIGRAHAIAKAQDIPCAVMSFSPHPRMFFSEAHTPIQLMGFHQKMQGLEALGADIAYVMRFNEAFSRLTADDFVQQVLFDGLGAKHIIIGDDFIYGYKRSGNRAHLQEKAENAGVGFTCVQEVALEGARCSSTQIRGFLSTGHMEAAARMLGHPYTIQGFVVHNDGRGAQIGFPTANIRMRERYVPVLGVYVVEAAVDGTNEWWQGVANIGRRPTVDGHNLWLEVHLLDHDERLYGKRLNVRLHHFLREETRFEDVEALKAQIAEDVAHTKQWFAEGGHDDDRRTG